MKLWTGAKPKVVTEVLGPTLKSFDVKHKFLPVTEQLPNFTPGDTYLCFGSTALGILHKAGLAPKNRKIGSLRNGEILTNNGETPIMVTYDPSMVFRDYARKPEIIWDLNLAIRRELTGTLEPTIGKYRYVKDFSDAIKKISNTHTKTGKRVPVSIDLETVGLFPYYKDKYIVSISVTYKKGESDVIYFKSATAQPKKDSKLWGQIHFLLNSNQIAVRGANFKFDLTWMSVKWGMECTNFKFDTLLVGSLLDENRTNSLNMHAKIYTGMGGYDDCVVPETPICTDDLRWVPIGGVVAGDGLLGFDEFINDKNNRRSLRKAKAVSTKRLIKPCVEIVLSNGKKIRCSEDHGFLAHRYKGNGPFQWVHAKDLRKDCRIQSAIDKEMPLTSWDAGYASGLYDGEGYVSCSGNGIQSGISQKPGDVWDLYTKIMTDVGLGGFYANEKNTDGVMTSKHAGAATFRMLQIFRPIRLLSKYCYDGKRIPSGVKKVTVVSVTPIGNLEVVSLETTTHTFVAEGLCSHNSFNDTYDKSRMDLVPKPDLLNYGGGDTDACLRTSGKLRNELIKDKRLANFYIKLLQPSVQVFEKMERRGLLVDMPAYEKLRVDVSKELNVLASEAFQMMPRKIRLKYSDNLSLTRDAILREFLFSKRGMNLKPQMFTPKPDKDGNKRPSCAMEHLEMFHDNPDAQQFVEIMRNYNSAKKTLSTYIDGFMKHLRPDGRFHPTYMLHRGDYGGSDSGTVTGRTSAKDPAYQTIPKHTRYAKPLRKVYIAPPGMVVLNCDFSQGELRVAACVAQEETMIDAYKNGIDLHSVTAAKLAGYDFDEFMKLPEAVRDGHRSGGKAGNFGLLYGMSAGGFMNYARVTYGVNLSLTESENFSNGFFELYPKLVDWHAEYKALAHRWGQVRSPLGRVRHLPLINTHDNETRAKQERQAINSPIQSTLSDLAQLAMVHLDMRYPDLEMVGMTHDSLTMYVEEDKSDIWAARVVDVMENLPIQKDFGWNPQLKFIADAEAGLNMADLKKIKLAA